MQEDYFTTLLNYLSRVPAIKKGIGSGIFENGLWWVKFGIDIDHQLAWHVIQEFGNVVNYLSIEERLSTVFYPVSPPSYLNGGPKDFLSWVIESKTEGFTPNDLKEWLDARIPNPVDELDSWIDLDSEEDDE